MAAMSDEHAGDDHAGPDHGADDHGADHGHDDHGHAEEPLGPIDIGKWSAGVGGVLVGLFVAACFGFSTGWL
jgi:hypothetical protein